MESASWGEKKTQNNAESSGKARLYDAVFFLFHVMELRIPLLLRKKYLCLVQKWREVCWTFMWCLSHRLELAISDRLHEHLLSIKQYLRNLYYLYEKSTKKSLVYFIKLWKNIYDFQNRQLKLAKFYGTPWSRSSGAKHDWFCWQVGSLHSTYRKCHFWYSNALWHSHVRRVEKPNGWS